MDRSTRFYSDTLGLEIAYSSPYWTSFKVGEGQIGLHGPSDPSLTCPVGGWVLSLIVNDLPSLKTKLEKDGATVTDGYHDTPRGAILTFEDPDGNRIQAMQLGVKAAELT